MGIIIPKPEIEEYDYTQMYSYSEPVKVIDEALGREEYRLTIDARGINISGGSEIALKYADYSLKQIVTAQSVKGHELPKTRVLDKPEYEIRSFHLDSVRHFIPVQELKKMIKMAAFFKFNNFHWHLTDDQGWRSESMLHPQLHLIGGLRMGDHFGNYSDDEPYSAFYTQQQLKEIVNYCAGYGINVVPEIDLPGHMTALLAAFPQFSCTGEELAVGTKGGIYEELLCAGNEDAFTFLFEVLGEICDIFPGKYFHIGGDEAPKTRWKACPKCNRRMLELGLRDMRELQGYYMNRVADFLASRGKTSIVWNEATYGGNLNKSVIVQEWIKSDNPGLSEHIAAGGKKILSPVDNAYCDYPYGMCSLKDVYMLDTSDESIIGTECLLWSEYIRTTTHLETYAWPRYTASAECGWSGNRREINEQGFEDFTKRLRVILPLFEELGMEYTDELYWVPDEAEAKRQTDEFNLNFAPHMIVEVHGDINEVI